MELNINGKRYSTDAEPDMPLLWVLRDELGLTGTKYGCGIAQCGVCTVLVDGVAVRSCQMALEDVTGAITTIDAPATDPTRRAVEAAWIAHQVAQCGYCQSGQVLQATALLDSDPDPDDDAIDAVMWGNLCRCGTYPRIRAAIKSAAHALREA